MAVTVRDRMRRPEPPPVLDPVPAFALINRDGRPVHLQDLAGAPWIADFIFTRCPASCPLMTARMARLERELPRDLGVRLVSFTVDPERDTPAVLQRYAAVLQGAGALALPDRPQGGDLPSVAAGVQAGHRFSAAPGTTVSPAVEPILHSTRFVLVDAQGRIRGYYDGFDEESMAKLRRDLDALAG